MANGIGNLDEFPVGGLAGLLGEDRVEDIKDQISRLIVDRVREDLNDYQSFIFYPGDYDQDMEAAYKKVRSKIMKMYEGAMLEAAEKAVKAFVDSVNDSTMEACRKKPSDS